MSDTEVSGTEVNGGRIKKPTGLGRGLSALLGDLDAIGIETKSALAGPRSGTGFDHIAISSIRPNPDQPRRVFDEEALEELAQSIRTRGLLQPLIVRRSGDGYQIVAGERRWRAAQRAGLHHLPVVIKALDDGATLEVALIENIQRKDLNALEEADSYRRLIAEFGHTQEALGALVHKSRSHVANLLRLLDLPQPVRAAVADERLTMGHARALLGCADPEALMADVLAKRLSVRETEALVRSGRAVQRPLLSRATHRPNPDIDALEQHVGATLGLKVKIAHGPKGGLVSVSYASLEQLDLICQRLSGADI